MHLVRNTFISIALLVFTTTGFAVASSVTDGCGNSGSKKVEKLYKEAITFLNQEKHNAALKVLKEAVAKDDRYAKAFYLIAHIYSLQGDYVKAKINFQNVLEVCVDFDPEIHLSLAKLEFKLEKYHEAVQYANDFLDMEYSNPQLEDEAIDIIKTGEFYHSMFSNPVPFDPKPMSGICTSFDEYLPMLTPDNDFLYFTRRHKKDSKFTVIGDAWVEEFCVAVKKEDGSFTSGKPLRSPFNQSQNEGGASLSKDNKNIFITVCNSPQGAGSCDVFYSERRGESWSELSSLGKNVNDSLWQSQVSCAPDGKRLYFSSDRKGGYGGKDIYYTVFKKGEWTKPVNLGPEINTEADEKSPFIHQDGITLYFSSEGHLGLGGFDIFISRIDGQGKWTQARNIGYPINSESDDLGFFASTNGKKGYFASNKLEGKGGWDIYEFDLYEGIRPKKVLFVKGSVTDESGNAVRGAQLKLKDLITKSVKSIDVDSITGEYVYSEIFENDQMLTINSEGYFYDEMLITETEVASVNNIQFDSELLPVEIGSSFQLNNILFDTDKYDLKLDSKLSLDNLVDFLNTNKSIQLEVAGHTDDVGDDEKNKILSDNRARVVFEYLISSGIDSNRVRYIGYGEEFPKVENTDEINRSLNRRTEIKILESM
ncbi:MAG: OmpA family protein [Chitinophagales bacterium]|nr:OmpA family protein [Chitinophagales bacterium]